MALVGVPPLDLQVVLMDENKEAVEGQQADGAPCGKSNQVVITVTITGWPNKRSKVSSLTNVIGSAQEVQQQGGIDEVR